MSAPRILVVEHESDSGAAMLGERAVQRGFVLDLATPGRGIPRSAAGYEMVLPMGAAPSVNDDHIQPWFQDEVALLQDADWRGIPVFGVCFGAQALAVALGGSVARASQPDIGWYEVQSTKPHLISSGPWFEWHVDAITPPFEAEILATTETCVQAYVVGKHLAVQFHPEVTDNEIGQWVAAEQGTLSRLGIDGAVMLSETLDRLCNARERAYKLFDDFLRHAGLAGGC